MTEIARPTADPERNRYAETGVTWSIAARGITVRSLGENEFALFNAAFADSTLLNAVDACLLRLLEDCGEKGLAEDGICKMTAEALDIPLDQRLRDYVRESLSQMESMGLLASDPSV